MSHDIALYAFVVINALTSFGTLAIVFFLIKNQKSSSLQPQDLPQDKVEENLTTRLRDLQMRQFSLKVPNYRVPSHINKDIIGKDKK